MGFIRFELGAGGQYLGLDDGHGQKIRADRKKLQFESGESDNLLTCCAMNFPWNSGLTDLKFQHGNEDQDLGSEGFAAFSAEPDDCGATNP